MMKLCIPDDACQNIMVKINCVIVIYRHYRYHPTFYKIRLHCVLHVTFFLSSIKYFLTCGRLNSHYFFICKLYWISAFGIDFVNSITQDQLCRNIRQVVYRKSVTRYTLEYDVPCLKYNLFIFFRFRVFIQCLLERKQRIVLSSEFIIFRLQLSINNMNQIQHTFENVGQYINRMLICILRVNHNFMLKVSSLNCNGEIRIELYCAQK